MVDAIVEKWRSLQYVPPATTSTYGWYGGYAHQPRARPTGRGMGMFGRGDDEPPVTQRWQTARCAWLNLEAVAFYTILEDTQRDFVQQFSLGEGIALNEAILENLFMILISVLNEIPIFVIGKPGSSKSLAMGLIQSNLNGDASDNDFLRSLPAVEVFPYQCSPLSTSAGIEQAFESARRYRFVVSVFESVWKYTLCLVISLFFTSEGEKHPILSSWCCSMKLALRSKVPTCP